MLDLGGVDAVSLTSTKCEKGVAKFAWSGDGRYIAYLSGDEKTVEKKAKDERGDDAMVYGENWEYGRLRIVKIATKRVTPLASEHCHVCDFAWSPDSKSIAYVTQRMPKGLSAYNNGTSVEVIGLEDRRVLKLSDFPTALEDVCWIAQDLWWRATYDLTSSVSSKSVYRLSIAAKTWSRHAFGETDCACTWAFPPGLRKVSDNSVAIQVVSRLTDQLHVLPDGIMLYNETNEVRSWHVASKDGKMVLAVVKSSAGTPSEVYSIVEGEAVCLSDHGQEIAELAIATSEPFYAKA